MSDNIRNISKFLMKKKYANSGTRYVREIAEKFTDMRVGDIKNCCTVSDKDKQDGVIFKSEEMALFNNWVTEAEKEFAGTPRSQNTKRVQAYHNVLRIMYNLAYNNGDVGEFSDVRKNARTVKDREFESFAKFFMSVQNLKEDYISKRVASGLAAVKVKKPRKVRLLTKKAEKEFARIQEGVLVFDRRYGFLARHDIPKGKFGQKISADTLQNILDSNKNSEVWGNAFESVSLDLDKYKNDAILGAIIAATRDKSNDVTQNRQSVIDNKSFRIIYEAVKKDGRYLGNYNNTYAENQKTLEGMWKGADIIDYNDPQSIKEFARRMVSGEVHVYDEMYDTNDPNVIKIEKELIRYHRLTNCSLRDSKELEAKLSKDMVDKMKNARVAAQMIAVARVAMLANETNLSDPMVRKILDKQIRKETLRMEKMFCKRLVKESVKWWHFIKRLAVRSDAYKYIETMRKYYDNINNFFSSYKDYSQLSEMIDGGANRGQANKGQNAKKVPQWCIKLLMWYTGASEEELFRTGLESKKMKTFLKYIYNLKSLKTSFWQKFVLKRHLKLLRNAIDRELEPVWERAQVDNNIAKRGKLIKNESELFEKFRCCLISMQKCQYAEDKYKSNERKFYDHVSFLSTEGIYAYVAWRKASFEYIGAKIGIMSLKFDKEEFLKIDDRQIYTPNEETNLCRNLTRGKNSVEYVEYCDSKKNYELIRQKYSDAKACMMSLKFDKKRLLGGKDYSIRKSKYNLITTDLELCNQIQGYSMVVREYESIKNVYTTARAKIIALVNKLSMPVYKKETTRQISSVNTTGISPDKEPKPVSVAAVQQMPHNVPEVPTNAPVQQIPKVSTSDIDALTKSPTTVPETIAKPEPRLADHRSIADKKNANETSDVVQFFRNLGSAFGSM